MHTYFLGILYPFVTVLHKRGILGELEEETSHLHVESNAVWLDDIIIYIYNHIQMGCSLRRLKRHGGIVNENLSKNGKYILSL